MFNPDEEDFDFLGSSSDDSIRKLLYKEYCANIPAYHAKFLDDNVLLEGKSKEGEEKFLDDWLKEVMKTYPHLSEITATMIVRKTFRDMPGPASSYFLKSREKDEAPMSDIPEEENCKEKHVIENHALFPTFLDKKQAKDKNDEHMTGKHAMTETRLDTKPGGECDGKNCNEEHVIEKRVLSPRCLKVEQGEECNEKETGEPFEKSLITTKLCCKTVKEVENGATQPTGSHDAGDQKMELYQEKNLHLVGSCEPNKETGNSGSHCRVYQTQSIKETIPIYCTSNDLNADNSLESRRYFKDSGSKLCVIPDLVKKTDSVNMGRFDEDKIHECGTALKSESNPSSTSEGVQEEPAEELVLMLKTTKEMNVTEESEVASDSINTCDSSENEQVWSWTDENGILSQSEGIQPYEHAVNHNRGYKRGSHFRKDIKRYQKKAKMDALRKSLTRPLLETDEESLKDFPLQLYTNKSLYDGCFPEMPSDQSNAGVRNERDAKEFGYGSIQFGENDESVFGHKVRNSDIISDVDNSEHPLLVMTEDRPKEGYCAEVAVSECSVSNHNDANGCMRIQPPVKQQPLIRSQHDTIKHCGGSCSVKLPKHTKPPRNVSKNIPSKDKSRDMKNSTSNAFLLPEVSVEVFEENGRPLTSSTILKDEGCSSTRNAKRKSISDDDDAGRSGNAKDLTYHHSLERFPERMTFSLGDDNASHDSIQEKHAHSTPANTEVFLLPRDKVKDEKASLKEFSFLDETIPKSTETNKGYKRLRSNSGYSVSRNDSPVIERRFRKDAFNTNICRDNKETTSNCSFGNETAGGYALSKKMGKTDLRVEYGNKTVVQNETSFDFRREKVNPALDLTDTPITDREKNGKEQRPGSEQDYTDQNTSYPSFINLSYVFANSDEDEDPHQALTFPEDTSDISFESWCLKTGNSCYKSDSVGDKIEENSQDSNFHQKHSIQFTNEGMEETNSKKATIFPVPKLKKLIEGYMERKDDEKDGSDRKEDGLFAEERQSYIEGLKVLDTMDCGPAECMKSERDVSEIVSLDIGSRRKGTSQYLSSGKVPELRSKKRDNQTVNVSPKCLKPDGGREINDRDSAKPRENLRLLRILEANWPKLSEDEIENILIRTKNTPYDDEKRSSYVNENPSTRDKNAPEMICSKRVFSENLNKSQVQACVASDGEDKNSRGSIYFNNGGGNVDCIKPPAVSINSSSGILQNEDASETPLSNAIKSCLKAEDNESEKDPTKHCEHSCEVGSENRVPTISNTKNRSIPPRRSHDADQTDLQIQQECTQGAGGDVPPGKFLLEVYLKQNRDRNCRSSSVLAHANESVWDRSLQSDITDSPFPTSPVLSMEEGSLLSAESSIHSSSDTCGDDYTLNPISISTCEGDRWDLIQVSSDSSNSDAFACEKRCAGVDGGAAHALMSLVCSPEIDYKNSPEFPLGITRPNSHSAEAGNQNTNEATLVLTAQSKTKCAGENSTEKDATCEISRCNDVMNIPQVGDRTTLNKIEAPSARCLNTDRGPLLNSNDARTLTSEIFCENCGEAEGNHACSQSEAAGCVPKNSRNSLEEGESSESLPLESAAQKRQNSERDNSSKVRAAFELNDTSPAEPNQNDIKGTDFSKERHGLLDAQTSTDEEATLVKSRLEGNSANKISMGIIFIDDDYELYETTEPDADYDLNTVKEEGFDNGKECDPMNEDVTYCSNIMSGDQGFAANQIDGDEFSLMVQKEDAVNNLAPTDKNISRTSAIDVVTGNGSSEALDMKDEPRASSHSLDEEIGGDVPKETPLEMQVPNCPQENFDAYCTAETTRSKDENAEVFENSCILVDKTRMLLQDDCNKSSEFDEKCRVRENEGAPKCLTLPEEDNCEIPNEQLQNARCEEKCENNGDIQKSQAECRVSKQDSHENISSVLSQPAIFSDIQNPNFVQRSNYFAILEAIPDSCGIKPRVRVNTCVSSKKCHRMVGVNCGDVEDPKDSCKEPSTTASKIASEPRRNDSVSEKGDYCEDNFASNNSVVGKQNELATGGPEKNENPVSKDGTKEEKPERNESTAVPGLKKESMTKNANFQYSEHRSNGRTQANMSYSRSEKPYSWKGYRRRRAAQKYEQETKRVTFDIPVNGNSMNGGRVQKNFSRSSNDLLETKSKKPNVRIFQSSKSQNCIKNDPGQQISKAYGRNSERSGYCTICRGECRDRYSQFDYGHKTRQDRNSYWRDKKNGRSNGGEYPDRRREYETTPNTERQRESTRNDQSRKVQARSSSSRDFFALPKSGNTYDKNRKARYLNETKDDTEVNVNDNKGEQKAKESCQPEQKEKENNSKQKNGKKRKPRRSNSKKGNREKSSESQDCPPKQEVAKMEDKTKQPENRSSRPSETPNRKSNENDCLACSENMSGAIPKGKRNNETASKTKITVELLPKNGVNNGGMSKSGDSNKKISKSDDTDSKIPKNGNEKSSNASEKLKISKSAVQTSIQNPCAESQSRHVSFQENLLDIPSNSSCNPKASEGLSSDEKVVGEKLTKPNGNGKSIPPPKSTANSNNGTRHSWKSDSTYETNRHYSQPWANLRGAWSLGWMNYLRTGYPPMNGWDWSGKAAYNPEYGNDMYYPHAIRDPQFLRNMYYWRTYETLRQHYFFNAAQHYSFQGTEPIRRGERRFDPNFLSNRQTAGGPRQNVWNNSRYSKSSGRRPSDSNNWRDRRNLRSEEELLASGDSERSSRNQFEPNPYRYQQSSEDLRNEDEDLAVPGTSESKSNNYNVGRSLSKRKKPDGPSYKVSTVHENELIDFSKDVTQGEGANRPYSVQAVSKPGFQEIRISCDGIYRNFEMQAEVDPKENGAKMSETKADTKVTVVPFWEERSRLRSSSTSQSDHDVQSRVLSCEVPESEDRTTAIESYNFQTSEKSYNDIKAEGTNSDRAESLKFGRNQHFSSDVQWNKQFNWAAPNEELSFDTASTCSNSSNLECLKQDDRNAETYLYATEPEEVSSFNPCYADSVYSSFFDSVEKDNFPMAFVPSDDQHMPVCDYYQSTSGSLLEVKQSNEYAPSTSSSFSPQKMVINVTGSDSENEESAMSMRCENSFPADLGATEFLSPGDFCNTISSPKAKYFPLDSSGNQVKNLTAEADSLNEMHRLNNILRKGSSEYSPSDSSTTGNDSADVNSAQEQKSSETRCSDSTNETRKEKNGISKGKTFLAPNDNDYYGYCINSDYFAGYEEINNTSGNDCCSERVLSSTSPVNSLFQRTFHCGSNPSRKEGEINNQQTVSYFEGGSLSNCESKESKERNVESVSGETPVTNLNTVERESQFAEVVQERQENLCTPMNVDAPCFLSENTRKRRAEEISSLESDMIHKPREKIEATCSQENSHMSQCDDDEGTEYNDAQISRNEDSGVAEKYFSSPSSKGAEIRKQDGKNDLYEIIKLTPCKSMCCDSARNSESLIADEEVHDERKVTDGKLREISPSHSSRGVNMTDDVSKKSVVREGVNLPTNSSSLEESESEQTGRVSPAAARTAECNNDDHAYPGVLFPEEKEWHNLSVKSEEGKEYNSVISNVNESHLKTFKGQYAYTATDKNDYGFTRVDSDEKSCVQDVYFQKEHPVSLEGSGNSQLLNSDETGPSVYAASNEETILRVRSSSVGGGDEQHNVDCVSMNADKVADCLRASFPYTSQGCCETGMHENLCSETEKHDPPVMDNSESRIIGAGIPAFSKASPEKIMDDDDASSEEIVPTFFSEETRIQDDDEGFHECKPVKRNDSIFPDGKEKDAKEEEMIQKTRNWKEEKFLNIACENVPNSSQGSKKDEVGSKSGVKSSESKSSGKHYISENSNIFGDCNTSDVSWKSLDRGPDQYFTGMDITSGGPVASAQNFNCDEEGQNSPLKSENRYFPEAKSEAPKECEAPTKDTLAKEEKSHSKQCSSINASLLNMSCGLLGGSLTKDTGFDDLTD